MNVLQEHLNKLRASEAPIPLTNNQACAQALRLRSRGMTYPNIAIAMSVYHDQWYSATHWRNACRARGASPVPRGYGWTSEWR